MTRPGWTTALNGHRAVLLLLVFFVLAGTSGNVTATGDDLAASYVGCRLLAQGQGNKLYAHDPEKFDVVGSAAWDITAVKGHVSGALHPYVQTPLWAYLLQPVCTAVTFGKFNALFVLLAMVALAGTLWLVARHWAPSFLQPPWLAAALILFGFSTPYQYAMWLTQTHALFIFLAVYALVLAEQKRSIAAGLMLALSATVKITPALLIIYWAAKRDLKPVVAFVASFALLSALTVALVGWNLTHTYLTELQRISNVLLVSFNNQSLAAWWLGNAYPTQELFHWHMYTLPASVKLTSTALSVLSVAAAGLMDRTPERTEGTPPLGAGLALVAITIFAPIAWTHYFIVLVVPLMMLAHLAGVFRIRWLWVGIGAVVLLNLQPFTFNTEFMNTLPLTVTRGHFLSGIATIALGVAAAARIRARYTRTALT